jgi:hypothetical protein
MKRTTVEIDEELLERGRRALNQPTMRATIEEALRSPDRSRDGRQRVLAGEPPRPAQARCAKLGRGFGIVLVLGDERSQGGIISPVEGQLMVPGTGNDRVAQIRGKD